MAFDHINCTCEIAEVLLSLTSNYLIQASFIVRLKNIVGRCWHYAMTWQKEGGEHFKLLEKRSCDNRDSEISMSHWILCCKIGF